MAHPTLVWGLLFFVPKSIALQISSVEDDAPRVFVSANQLWCGQAPANIANDALRLYKSMPRGKLYKGVSVNDSGSCEQLGYNMTIGEDPCYPGLKNFYRNDDEKNKFIDEFKMTLQEYGELSIDLYDANLVDACKCKEGSFAKKSRGDSCKQVTSLQSLVEYDPVRTFVSKNKKFCAEAQKHLANEALSLYKSMPRGKLYDGAVLRNDKSCKRLGYHWSTGMDPCFPGLRTYYRNDEEKQEFLDDLQTTLKNFGDVHNFTLDDVLLIDSCQCRENSYIKHSQGNSCNKTAQIQGSVS